jgi:hypothetical protein
MLACRRHSLTHMLMFIRIVFTIHVHSSSRECLSSGQAYEAIDEEHPSSRSFEIIGYRIPRSDRAAVRVR